MPEEIKDENQESSPELKEALEGTSPVPTEQQPEAETGTPKEPETQEEQPQEKEEVPFHEHPRFKELVTEKNWYRERLEEALQQRQQPFQQPQPQDPYAGMTPEERVFWQNVDKRAEEKARLIIEREVRPVIDAGRAEIARMNVTQFRQRYPDVKSDSSEEIAIAEKIRQGSHPDDAYWIVMGPQKVQEAEGKAKQQVKQQVEAKKKANVEASGSVPPQAQSQKKLSFTEELATKLGIQPPYKLPPLKK